MRPHSVKVSDKEIHHCLYKAFFFFFNEKKKGLLTHGDFRSTIKLYFNFLVASMTVGHALRQ